MRQLEGIQEFIAVVDHGGFSAAARVLNISKSHISQQVHRLEDRLGSRLLHRTTRKVSLTETGATYLERCRPLLEELESAELAISSLQDVVQGRIRISSPHLLGEVFIIPALTKFQKLHPRLNIDIDLSSTRIDLIDDHYDVAIQLSERTDINVVNKVLCNTYFHVVASPEYIDKHGSPAHPNELQKHQCLLFANQGESKPWKFTDGKTNVGIHIKSHWRSNSGHLLRAGARRGLGLAYLPDYYLYEDLEAGALISVMPEWQSIERKLVAIYQHKAHLPTKIRLFVEFLTQFIQCNGGIISHVEDTEKNK